MNKLNLISQRLVIIFCLGLLVSCAASKSAYSPTGTWNYEVKNTPNGDATGKMMLTQEGGAYTGNLQTSEYGTIQMRDVSLEGNALQSTIYVQGEAFKLNGLFEGDSFSGKIISKYGTFDVMADRAK